MRRLSFQVSSAIAIPPTLFPILAHFVRPVQYPPHQPETML
jgi:hypothetical protein